MIKNTLRFCCLILVLAATFSTNAATNRWTGVQCEAPAGGSCDWGADGNWAPPVPPPSDPTTVPLKDGTADIVFSGNVGTSPRMNDNWNVHSITFDVAAATFNCNGSGRTLTLQAGIVNNSLNLQIIGGGSAGPISLGASQTWSANTADLRLTAQSPIINNSNDLTITGISNISLFPTMSGSGGLVKNGSGTLFLGLGGAFNNLYTGFVIINQGALQIDGAQTIRKATSVTLNGGKLVLNRQNSIGSATTSMIFNGGKLQAIAPSPGIIPSDFYGALMVSNNNSSIDLAPADGFSSPLTFASGSRPGNGSLTINGWTGTAGSSGTADKIFITNAPTADVLSAISFTGFSPGAVRLPNGEIVPAPPALVWVGLGTNDNWSTGSNWIGGSAPLNNGTALLSFDGANRPTPFTDVGWDVLGLNYAATATDFENSGLPVTIRSFGITNYSSQVQAILNDLVLAAPQTWNASAGALFFGGANNNGGFLLTIDGSSNTTFSTVGTYSGAGGLTKNGTGTLSINANMTFTGPVTLNGGTIETETDNAFAGQNLTLNGGTLSALGKSQTFGVLTLTGNSTIELQPGDGAGTLTFAGGTRTGGLLTINGWTGTAGLGGSDDRIFSSTNFLSAIQFTGFPAGAMRLPSGEIVPPGTNAPPAPALASPMRISNTEFQFTILGTAGQTYTVQSSQNLTNWISILTTNAPNNSFTVTDPNATNNPGFYRVFSSP